jgi:hypothetical protein
VFLFLSHCASEGSTRKYDNFSSLRTHTVRPFRGIDLLEGASRGAGHGSVPAAGFFLLKKEKKRKLRLHVDSIGAQIILTLLPSEVARVCSPGVST